MVELHVCIPCLCYRTQNINMYAHSWILHNYASVLVNCEVLLVQTGLCDRPRRGPGWRPAVCRSGGCSCRWSPGDPAGASLSEPTRTLVTDARGAERCGCPRWCSQSKTGASGRTLSPAERGSARHDRICLHRCPTRDDTRGIMRFCRALQNIQIWMI